MEKTDIAFFCLIAFLLLLVVLAAVNGHGDAGLPVNDARVLSQWLIAEDGPDIRIKEVCIRGRLFVIAHDYHGMGVTQVLEDISGRLVPVACPAPSANP